MTYDTYIFLKGLPAPVAIADCPDVIAILPQIISFWPYEIRKQNTGGVPAFFTVQKHKDGYLAGSPYFQAPKPYPNAVNTVCSLVAELAWEQLRTNPALLCVHAAAIEINGRLLLIPNKRRAGKSTLTAALAAQGYRVFTDDFVPLAVNEQNQLCGVACGIAPRLRLPLPKGFGAKNTAFIASHKGPENGQYQYLSLDDKGLANKGDMLPIGGIMVLNRDDNNPLAMTNPQKGDVLRVLVTQNFAREMKSGGILRSLEFLVSNAECHELSYANVEDTTDLINTTFAHWHAPIAKFNPDSNPADFQTANLNTPKNSEFKFKADDPLCQTPGVVYRDLGDKKFLSDQNGMAIHQLNETSAAIWQLLEEPTSLQDLADIFQQAFPDNEPRKLSDDIRKTLEQMTKAGLIQHEAETVNG